MNTITLPAALIRGAMACQATKDVRYYLNGILLAENGDIVGTDGHAAFRGNCQDSGIESDVIISIDGKIHAKAESVQFVFNEDGLGGIATIDSGKVFSFKVIDGKYPDYNRVIPSLPRENHSNGFTVDSGLLSKVEKTFGKGSAVNFFPGSSHECILVQYAGKGTGVYQSSLENAVIAIMPMRSSADFDTLFGTVDRAIMADEIDKDMKRQHG
mgnify:CR=1 FL=1|tara:strand:- start:802 stop:1440 length:639 start_codon:yes stop_codon:yes gene_type:complete